MAGPVTIDWGDGTPVANGPEQGQVSHTYATPGEKTIQVCDQGTPNVCTTRTVTIPMIADLELTATQDTSDATRMTTRLLVDNAGQGAVTINWGDSTAAGNNPGDGTTPSTHQYASAGTYTITVTDATDSSRTATANVTVPYPAAMTVTAVRTPDDPSGQSVNVTVNNAGQGAVTITWGEGSPATSSNPGDGTTATTHAYPTAGQKTISVVDANQPSRTGQAQVTLPLLPTASVEGATGTSEALLTYANTGQGTVSIDWGDGTAVATGQPETGTDVAHDYAAAGSGTYTVIVTDESTPANAAQVEVTIPFP